ncbi:MAG TPA: (d)CMP kinase [Jatrophihabitans sp.]|uniref:(d)CMP kinase n=1 Tax=Jatrophihabitans sp. TaxID=1932789 RepID=UPI002F1E6889
MPTDFSEAPEFRGVVALDGPSGTGKSTVARLLARRLHAQYLDTGAMYRAATVAVLRAGVDLNDPAAVAAEVATSRIDVGTDPEHRSTRLNGTDVEREIRTAATTAAVSAVSAVPDVRTQLVAQQRLIIGRAPTVAEGRDIGSVVWPDAELKVYLTAREDVRARRRAGELGSLHSDDVDRIAQSLRRRDAFDSSRAASPLRRPDGATEVDTSDLAIDEVVELLAELAFRAISAADRA